MPEGADEKRKLGEISSFISDLPSAVQKFWSGVAEPFFELSISLIVVFFALGGDKPISVPLSAVTQGPLEGSSSIKALMSDGYGVKALIPVAVLIFLIGIAQGVSKLLRVIGAAIPGQLVPHRANLMIKWATGPEIIEAWQYNPKLDTVEELNTEIDSAIGRVPADPAKDILSKIRVLQARSESIASTASFVKGLFVTTVIISVLLCVFESWPIHFHRLALILAFTLVALTYLAFGRVQAEREYAGGKVREYNSQKKVFGETPRAADDVHSRAEKYNAAREALGAPWTLNIVPPDAGDDLRILGRALIGWPGK
jgi:hypothetical protein